MMKQHTLYLIYLVLNIHVDRQSQFFTNLNFLTKPVFFKLFPRQYLVLGALHCGTVCTPWNTNQVNYFALLGNKTFVAFT